MEFNDILRKRRSTRRFSSTQVKQEDLDDILLAGLSAPIGSNLNRDIHITVLQDADIMQKLCAAQEVRMKDRDLARKIKGDVVSAGNEQPVPLPFYGAPTVIIVSHRAQTIQPGIEYANATSVVHTMHLAATAQGLGSVYVWGIFEAMRMNPEMDCTSLLKLPDAFSPLMGLMVGYPDKPLAIRDIDEKKFPIVYLR